MHTLTHRLLCGASLLALAIGTTACSAERSIPHSSDRAKPTASAPQTDATAHETDPIPPGQTPTLQRMVIREATLELRADAPQTIGIQITQLAEGSGGFVVHSEANGVGDAVTRVDITVRVPSQQFEPTLSQMRGLGKVLREEVSGKDVTEEYVDLEARLRTKRHMEERMLAILQQAASVEDTLKVEQELGRVRSDIEKIVGRKRYLEDRVSFSTIHVNAVAPYQPSASDGESFSSQIGSALQDSVDIFIAVIAGI
ncbi:MAG: DUF4349 domain-containing protein, partial [Myxococcota bacterium]